MKLDFGHHGGNHPVMNVATGQIEITSQNHNFAVAEGTLGDVARVTHINGNDGTIEGLELVDGRAFSIQYHPEADPGPHEAAVAFDRFVRMVMAR